MGIVEPAWSMACSNLGIRQHSRKDSMAFQLVAMLVATLACSNLDIGQRVLEIERGFVVLFNVNAYDFRHRRHIVGDQFFFLLHIIEEFPYTWRIIFILRKQANTMLVLLAHSNVKEQHD